MRDLRRLLMGVASAATWPFYLTLLAYAAKAAPWPHDLTWPACLMILAMASSLFVANLGRMAFRRKGWAEEIFQAPREVRRQLRRVCLTLAIAGFVLLMPEFLLSAGLIAPGGRPISAVALCRMLGLGFELTCVILAYRLLRSSSPLLTWISQDPTLAGWAGRHRRVLTTTILTALGMVLVLDAAGFRFTARRLTMGGALTTILVAACWGSYLLLLRLIERQAWRWHKTDPVQAITLVEGDASHEEVDADGKLRTLARVLVSLLGVFGLSTIWNVDLALFYYISEQKLWTLSNASVEVGDVLQMALTFFITAGLWRYLNTMFTLVIFPRMPDDPGIRYAVVTLCRYVVLAVGLLTGLSAIHLGLERIGVVLAALGVGLGFGLQEIVSNFVSGIILLLERPIRVGDVVTVADMTGKVDRINIRATTIINGDNQSMIIPNRQFITGNLINWTHKDKIMRVVIKVNVAPGTDADKVTDLLLAIAHADPDVLNNPVPSSLLDAFGDGTLQFILHVFVPEPSLMGRVRHRLYAEIQHRFEASGIVIPVPTRELRVHPSSVGLLEESVIESPNRRVDPPGSVPPPPRFAAPILPVPAEECHRGVDE